MAAAQRSIHQCRDAEGGLVFQDQPCRGELHRADQPPPAQRWLTEELGPCQLRSPKVDLMLLPLSDSNPVPDPPVVGVWLELHGGRDGIALRIRGFDPLPDSGMAFDTNITGQGIRTPAGQLIAVDSLDGPGSLRYGHRGSAILLAGLLGATEATLEIRIRGFHAISAPLDLAPVLEAHERLQKCRQPEKIRSGQRRLPGRPR